MASPFKVFRKHQKAMLAVLGLLAMISFVVLPIALDMLSAGRVKDTVVVSTSRYGDLRESRLLQLLHNRQIVNGFLQRLVSAVQMAGKNPQPVLMELRRIGPADEEQVVDTWLMARRAAEMGLVVSDETINQFLVRLTTGQGVPASQVRQILRNLRISEQQLFDLLRHELLALHLQEMFEISLAATTPGQRWDYYKQLNLKAALELIPRSVSEYAEQVPAPSEAELRAFFEEYKGQPDDPTSPEPGFRIPKKIALEYIKGDQSELADPQSVPMEEVKAYYEANKERYYRSMELPEVEEDEGTAADEIEGGAVEEREDGPAVTVPSDAMPEGAPEASEEPQSPVKPDGEAEAAAGPAVEPVTPTDTEKARAEEPATEEPPAEEASPAEPPGSTSPQGVSEPGNGIGGAPTTEAPAKEAAVESPMPEPEASEEGAPSDEPASKEKQTGQPEDASEAEPNQAASPRGRSPFRLTALLQEESEEETPRESAEAKPEKPSESGSGGPEEPEPRPSGAPGASGPATSVSGREEADQGASPTSEPVVEDQTPPDGESAEEELEALVDAATSEPKPEFIPLEQVEDQIRRQLAHERAQEVLDRLRDKMQRFRDEWIVYESLPQAEKEGKEPPPRPDLVDLAKPFGLSVYKTGLISALEARQLDIGNSTLRSRNVGFLQYAFENLDLFKPEISRDLELDYYLFWITDQTEDRVPEFDDPGIREQVLSAWKEVKARQLAATAAEELAEKARQADASLEKVFGDRPGLEVIETEPFSWSTFGPMGFQLWNPREPEISEVKQKVDAGSEGEGEQPAAVASPGDEFMRAVFRPTGAGGAVRDLAVGDVGVAMNAPKTKVFVYRIADLSPSLEVLRKQFFFENYDRYRLAGFGENVETYRRWRDEIRESVDLKWEREPQVSRRG